MSSINDLPAPTKAKTKARSIDDLPAPPEAEPDPSTGAGQAAIEHFGNAASLGYLPQLQAITSKMMPNPNSELDEQLKAQGFKIDQKDPTYVQERDANLRRLELEAKEHPGASLAGTIGGSLASGIASSGLAPINAVSRTGRILQAAKGGALLGAFSNPGDREGELAPIQIDDRAKGLAQGAALGAAGQGLIEGVASGAKKLVNLPGSMQDKAEERAFKAAGAMLKDYRTADKNGQVHEIGRFMLDNNLVKPGETVADIAENSTSLRNQLGEKIGAAYKKAKDALRGQDIPLANLDPSKLGDEFLQEFATSQKGVAGGGQRLKSVQAIVDDLKSLPSDGGFDAVNKFRQGLDDLIYAHNKTPGTLPESKEGLAALRSWIDQRVDGAISAVDRATGGQVSQELPGLNRQYGLASQVSKISKDQALRQNANRFFSPGDRLTAATGAMVGAASGDGFEDRVKKAAMGAGLGVASKLGRSYGTPILSLGLDKVGGALAKTGLPAVAAMVNPAMNAAERGPVSLANTVRVMSSPSLEATGLPRVASNGQDADRMPADQEKPAPKAEDRWAQKGADKLGLSGSSLDQAMQSKEVKRLLIEASDLPAGSPALKRIMDKIQKAQGQK